MTTTDFDELLGDIPDDGATSINPFEALTLEEETPTITYDLKETLAFLKPLVTEANDKNKAKFVLAIIALTRLVGRFPCTRKDLLAGYPEFSKPGKEIQPSSMRIDWFKALLERMLQQGLISILMDGSTRLYRAEPSQKQHLESIILDAMHNKGYEIRHLLWPNDYPQETGRATSTPEEEASEEGRPVREEREEDVNLIQELTAQLMTTLSPLAQHLEGIYGKLEELEVKMSGHALTMEKIGPTIDQKFAEFAKQLELRTLLQSVAERLADQQSRRKSLVNQLSTNSTHEEKIMVDLGTAIAAVLASGTKP